MFSLKNILLNFFYYIKLSTENVRLIIDGIRDSSNVSSGVTIGNDKCIFVNCDPEVFIVLKNSPIGIVAMKTHTGKNKWEFRFQGLNYSLGVIIGMVQECPGDKGFSKKNPQIALKHISHFAHQLMKYSYWNRLNFWRLYFDFYFEHSF